MLQIVFFVNKRVMHVPDVNQDFIKIKYLTRLRSLQKPINVSSVLTQTVMVVLILKMVRLEYVSYAK